MKRILISIFFTLFFCGFSFSQESRSLKILEKPSPQLTEKQIKTNIEVQGTVALGIEFLASGQIGRILPISTLPFGLTENAIEAAKKIRFEPEVKNDMAIGVFKTVQYRFKCAWLPERQKVDELKSDEKAEAIIKRAVENLGGEKYLQVKSQIGRGKYHILHDGALVSYQTFIDVTVLPDRERTEFKLGSVKNVQTNAGNNGWVFDGAAQAINDQSKDQVENFKRGLRTSLDYLLRGYWRNNDKASLSYVGKREAGVGKRNDVIKLTFEDNFSVEFEFAAADGMPIKALYKRTNGDNEDVKEEDHYAQFIDIQGVKTPFIIDHFSNKMQTSRINYESIEFNKAISDSIFSKPASAKDLKKDLKP